MEKRLKIETYPIADSENIVRFENFRITVLQDRLFRIEEDDAGEFCDSATQKVWYRNMEKQNFTVKEVEGGIVITTETCELLANKQFDNFRIKERGVWKKISNDGNLLGTYRTLDCCKGDEIVPPSEKKGRISLDIGVCSRTGVAFFADDSLILAENGMVERRRKQKRDIYLFAYGNDFRGAVNALYTITGKPPLIPRFAFGNWWSRYREYSDKEYLQVIQRFFDREIPLSVATVDMDWHYSVHLDAQKKIIESGRNTEYYGGNNGWTGYSWNKVLFPDYKAFLRKLKKLNLKVTLNLHPSLGVRWFEDRYRDMAIAMGIDPASGKHIQFDITDERFIDAYFNILHRPYEKDGVDFWWIDWQQGEQSKIDGLDPLWALNHYHYLANREGHDLPLILSRYADIGSHRYPLGFSGDTAISFDSLDFLPYFTATASNIGYTYWSHDIGGHYGYDKDDELYLRFVQFGVFNPIMRLHGESNPVSTKEPWYYGAEGLVAERFLKLRHSMIPFLYSCAYRTSEKGLALCEPMYYEYPNDDRAYKYRNEYIFGGQLIVMPITVGSDKDGYASVKGYLPKGRWTDIFTGQVYDGNIETEFVRNLESIPVFAKEGAIIPYSEDKGNSSDMPENLRIEVFDGNGEFQLYEDDSSTYFKTSIDGENRILTIKSDEFGFKRKVKIVFRNVPSGVVSVYKNGLKQRIFQKIGDCVTVILPTFSFGAEYKIIVHARSIPRLEEKKQAVAEKLMMIEGNYSYRQELYNEIISANKISEIKAVISKAKLSATIKKYIKEALL